MRLLVDTSIWSLALRRQPSAVVHQEAVMLKSFIEEGEDIFILGIILQEVLQGIRNQKDFNRLKEYFAVFPIIELEREDYVRAAELKNHLMKYGKQAATIDVLIASAAITHGCTLFTADQDFTYIAMHSKLKLLNKK
jgi:predicted nucleic acid-binding protein